MWNISRNTLLGQYLLKENSNPLISLKKR